MSPEPRWIPAGSTSWVGRHPGVGLALILAATAMGCSRQPAEQREPRNSSATAERLEARRGPPFSGSEAHELLGRLVRMERHYGAPGRQRTIDFLKSELGRVANQVQSQSFSMVEPGSGERFELTNLIGRIHPERSQRILLASHWDSRLWAEEDPDPSLRQRPGPYANDSGSGVALMLTLARLLRPLEQVGVDLVLFDGEEFGRPGSSDYCQGAKHYARELSRSRGPLPRAAIVADMVGDAQLDIFMEETSLQRAPELTEEIWRVARDLEVRAFHPRSKYSIVDDQTPLQELGIPAVLLIDYDYRQWHTHADTLDRTSAESLEAVGRVLLEVMWRLDARAGK